MIDKHIKVLELIAQVDEPLLRFFDTNSNRLLDLKIKVLTDLKNGKTISEIPRFYDILELYPSEETWD